ncbi:MAG: hypothetical protein U0521_01430 [Anaerolineae bacterium]
MRAGLLHRPVEVQPTVGEAVAKSVTPPSNVAGVVAVSSGPS